MKAAASDTYDHAVSHSEYETSLPPASIARWTAEVKAWEQDPLQPNPYEFTVITPTQASIHRELAEAEAQDLAAGRDFVLDENMSPSAMISLGMDLEMAQCALRVEASKIWLHIQDRQKTSYQLRSNSLSHKINAWIVKQQLYTPCVVVLRNAEPQESPLPHPVYQIPLWLPSQIGHKMKFDRRFSDIKWHLRVAQAYKSLDLLRNNLQIRLYLFCFKDRFVRGQTANTRARNTLATIQACINVNVETYRTAHMALLSLSLLLGKVGWQGKLQPLSNSDM